MQCPWSYQSGHAAEGFGSVSDMENQWVILESACFQCMCANSSTTRHRVLSTLKAFESADRVSHHASVTVWEGLACCGGCPNGVPMWTAPFLVGQRQWPRTCTSPGSGRKGDCNSWERLCLAVWICFNFIDRAKSCFKLDDCKHWRVCGENRQCPLSIHHPNIFGIVVPDESMHSENNQDLRQYFNWYRGKTSLPLVGIIFVGHTAGTEPIIVLNIITLNFATIVF